MSEVKTVNPTNVPSPGAPPAQTKTKDKSIVVLRRQSRGLDTDKDIEELEEKYSKKFGCKVIILEPNLEMVDYIK